MAVRDSLNNNAYEMYSMDNVLDSVDLTVSAWNRTTVADGQWLQDHAIGPLSARDVYLADQIDDANAAIDSIKETLNDVGIVASGAGANAVGYAIKPFNNQLYPSAQNEFVTMSLGDQPISLVSTGVSDSAISPYTVTYTTFGNATLERGGIAVSDDMLGSVLTLHNGDGTAYQLAFSDKGMWYRSLAGMTAQTMFDNGPVTYISGAGDFKQVPTDAITETVLNNTLNEYCKKTETCAKSDVETALAGKLDTTAFADYTANAPTKDYVAEAANTAYNEALSYANNTFAAKTELDAYITTTAANDAFASKTAELSVTAETPAIAAGDKAVSAWLQEIVDKINEIAASMAAS